MFLLLLVLIASCLTTALLRYAALKLKWVDIPNARSSHHSPIPGSGGAGFALMFFFATLFLFRQGLLMPSAFTALSLGLAMAILGLLDDRHNLRVGLRMLFQVLLAGLGLQLMGGLPLVPVFGFEFDFGWFGYVIGIGAFVWLVNLYNFMDGIDSLAALESCFAAGAAAVLALYYGNLQDALLLACLIAAVLGFTFWNLPPARIFMGDTGSNYLGYVLGILGMLTISHGFMHVWSWAILLGVFIVDSGLTLLQRVRTGQTWYQAHRSHAYQKAALKLGSHGRVVLAIMAINVFWLLPLAWISVAFVEGAVLITVLAYTPVILLALFLRAGLPDEGRA
ncbi:MAG: glycosyl transferase [Pseudomonadales bacterium]|nr:glycosyl transferase [Pseudomonadales bacterium]